MKDCKGINCKNTKSGHSKECEQEHEAAYNGAPEYKLSTEIKWTFIANVFLFITGVIFGEDLVIASSVVIFVILSVGIQILESIHETK